MSDIDQPEAARIMSICLGDMPADALTSTRTLFGAAFFGVARDRFAAGFFVSCFARVGNGDPFVKATYAATSVVMYEMVAPAEEPVDAPSYGTSSVMRSGPPI